MEFIRSQNIWERENETTLDENMLKSLSIYTGLLLLTTILLISIGLLMIASTTSTTSGWSFFVKQIIWIGIGMVGAVIVSRISQSSLVKYSHIFLFAVAAVLTYLCLLRFLDMAFGVEVAKKLPFCPTETVNGVLRGGIKGGFRWLVFPKKISLQPSEFAKVALLLFLASYYGTRDSDTIKSFYKGFLVPMVPTGYTLLAIFFGKDMSQTVITAMMVGAIMFLAGVKTRYLLISCVLAFVLAIGLVMHDPMRRARVMALFTPQTQEEKAQMAKTTRYQLTLSEMALGSGGLWGRGFMQSLMKNKYLPEAHTDFIIAILGEEFGLAGLLVVIALYTLFLLCLFNISRLCIDRVSMLICQGIAVLIAFQALINIGVVSGFFPTTGLTAPFISYGGSSSLSLLLCMGLVSNACINNMAKHANDLQNDVISLRKPYSNA